jgi:hypothetical protein
MGCSNTWRIRTIEKDREILSKVFPATNLRQALNMAKTATEVITDFGQDKDESQLSISSRDLLVILHGFSKGPVPELCRQLAKAIDKRLA